MTLLRDLKSTLRLLLNFELLMLPLLGILDGKALDLADESELVHGESLGKAGNFRDVDGGNWVVSVYRLRPAARFCGTGGGVG